MDINSSSSILFFNFYSIPPLITSVTALWFGLKISQNSSSKIHQLFLGWTTCVFLWLFSYSICYATTDENLAVLLSEFACTGVLFFATTYYHFLLSFLDRKEEMIFVKIGYFINIIMVPVTFVTDYILKGVRKMFFGYYVEASDYYWVLLLIFFSYLIRAQYLLAKVVIQKSLPEPQNRQAQYFLFALLIAYFSIPDFLPKFGIVFYPFGSIIIFIWIIIMNYAMTEKELIDIRLIIRRWLPYLIAVGLFIIIDVAIHVYQFIKGGG